NMYCGSVYGSLCALLSNVSSQDLQGKRVGIFSYGSGLASSFFSFRVKGSTEEMMKQIDLQNRLDSRRVVAPEVYDEMCNLRERAHLKKDYSPAGNPETLFPGTYYLTKVDEMFRREYAIKQ
ncbi:hydroxymethylglutaryl-CoA synthase, partial [Aureobasidium melanogenum]